MGKSLFTPEELALIRISDESLDRLSGNTDGRDYAEYLRSHPDNYMARLAQYRNEDSAGTPTAITRLNKALGNKPSGDPVRKRKPNDTPYSPEDSRLVREFLQGSKGILSPSEIRGLKRKKT